MNIKKLLQKTLSILLAVGMLMLTVGTETRAADQTEAAETDVDSILDSTKKELAERESTVNTYYALDTGWQEVSTKKTARLVWYNWDDTHDGAVIAKFKAGIYRITSVSPKLPEKLQKAVQDAGLTCLMFYLDASLDDGAKRYDLICVRPEEMKTCGLSYILDFDDQGYIHTLYNGLPSTYAFRLAGTSYDEAYSLLTPDDDTVELPGKIRFTESGIAELDDTALDTLLERVKNTPAVKDYTDFYVDGNKHIFDYQGYLSYCGSRVHYPGLRVNDRGNMSASIVAYVGEYMLCITTEHFTGADQNPYTILTLVKIHDQVYPTDRYAPYLVNGDSLTEYRGFRPGSDLVYDPRSQVVMDRKTFNAFIKLMTQTEWHNSNLNYCPFHQIGVSHYIGDPTEDYVRPHN